MEQEEVQQLAPETEALQRAQRIWLARIAREKDAHRDFRKRAREVDCVYRNEIKEEDTLYVPLFWSVVNVQKSGIYSNQPVPDVRAANENAPEIFSQVATMIGRGINAVVNDRSFDQNMNRSVEDFLAPGLGVMRVKLDTEVLQVPSDNPMAPPQQEVGKQKVRWQYVTFDCFGWEPCNHWENCNWIYFRHAMTRADIRRRFKKPVKASKPDGQKSTLWQKEVFDIYECWDKEKKKVLFIAEGESEPLEIADDPFELEDFYPCVPMWNMLRSRELIPVSDYDFIEPYDVELNRMQERRMGLLEQIRASGAYDEGFPELQGMLELDDGQYQSVKNLASRLNTLGGVENALYHLPIEEKIVTLVQLTQQMEVVKAQVDDILGISDIVRGSTKASETATAQEIKGRWVGVRLTRKREIVQHAVREMFRITAQVLTNAVTPENLQVMTQMPITEEMYKVLQQRLLTHFAIDVETQSTVAKDEFEERRTYQEMLNGVAQFAQAVLPAMAQNMLPADVGSAILRAGLKPYARFDRALEEQLKTLPTTQQQLMGQQQQMQQMGQQMQQLQQQLQQTMQALNELQNRATAATTAEKMAKAEKTGVETLKVVRETENEALEPRKTAAETGKIYAETDAIRRGSTQ